jgi:hypothetical protein
MSSRSGPGSALAEELLEAGERGILGRQRLELGAGALVAGAQADGGAHLGDRAALDLHHLVVEAPLVVELGVVGLEPRGLVELAFGDLGGARVAGHRDREPQVERGDLRRDPHELLVHLHRVGVVRHGHADLALHQQVLDLRQPLEVARPGRGRAQ